MKGFLKKQDIGERDDGKTVLRWKSRNQPLAGRRII